MSAATPWRVIASPTDAEMSAVEGAYLVADNLPIEDARLIAAAPELLRDLTDAVARLRVAAMVGGNDAEFVDDMLAPFMATIAKATGDAA